jgi:hypothetical protein
MEIKMEKIYDDYLHYCYVINKSLTEVDWEYYGREVHHIEVPDCEGGLLTPTNSQPLTTYQHWVAGILQSEVVGRKCFAMVPRGVLPPYLETLRKKWQNWHNKTANFPVRPAEYYSALGKVGGSKNKGQVRGPHSEERKRKIGDKVRGQKRGPETIQKMKENHYDISGWFWITNGIEETMVPPDHPLSETWVKGRKPFMAAAREKLSKSNSGENNPMYGVTPKTKQMRWFKDLGQVIEKMFMPGEEPEGWVKGRLTALDRRQTPLY